MPSLLNLKYSLRSLKQNKFTLFINIFGFSVSLAFVIMIGLYVQKEYSVDQSQQDKERIFRVENVGDDFRFGYPYHFFDDLKSNFPQIESVLLLYSDQLMVTIPGGGKFNSDILVTNKECFDILTFDFIEGSAATALVSMNDVVLSESFVRSHFGDKDALGQSIKLGDDEFNVSAVVADMKNSHIMPAPIIIRADYYIKEVPFLTDRGYPAWDMYIKTVPGGDVAELEASISAYSKKRFAWRNDPEYDAVHLRPFADIYLTPHTSNELSTAPYLRNNDPAFISTMLVTAVLILIFACINYLNLSVAQSGFRAKSTAIQRLLGSEKRTVFWGFIVESIGVLIVSGIIAIIIVWLVFPWFGSLMEMHMSFADEMSWLGFFIIAAITFVMGTVSGWVPATIISGFKPIDVTRGTLRRKTKSIYSKILITFQYTITIILLGCTAVIIGQIRYMQNSDLGFDTKNLIVCSYRSDALPADATALVNTLKNIPGVTDAVYCNGYPMAETNNSLLFDDNNGEKHSFSVYHADSSFISILGLKIKNINSYNPHGHWVNETAAKRLGIDNETIEYKSPKYSFPVKGILYDFHYQDFTNSIGELDICPFPHGYPPRNIIVKISGTDRAETLRRVREVYNDMAGGDLFDGRFIEDQIAYFYKTQQRLSNLLSLLSFIAIVISSMGMLAMSIYFTRQRARDMAVRKVFGATPRGVLGLLMGSFLKLVGVAFVIAVPVIYLLMQEWLSGYVYRIKLTPVPFLIAGGIVLAIAVLTVAGHSIKVAMSNPVDSLKAE